MIFVCEFGLNHGYFMLTHNCLLDVSLFLEQKCNAIAFPKCALILLRCQNPQRDQQHQSDEETICVNWGDLFDG